MSMLNTPFGQSVVSVVPTTHALADFGAYFVTTNPTPGTGLASNVQATFVDTTPFLYLLNGDGVGGKSIYLHSIKLIVTVAPASAAQAYYAIKTDNVARALSTDNMLDITPVNPNSGLPNGGQLLLQAQNSGTASVLAAASVNARLVARGAFGGLPIVGDELVINFGAPVMGSYPGLTAAQAVCPGRKCSASPPLILAPGHSAVMHLWFPGNAATGLSYELEMSHWER